MYIFLGCIIGLIIALAILWTRSSYAKSHGEKFFIYNPNLDTHGIKKRTRNLYTWTVFGFLIGLVFIIPSLDSDQTKAALIWTYLIGFCLIFLSIGCAIFIYKENKR